MLKAKDIMTRNVHTVGVDTVHSEPEPSFLYTIRVTSPRRVALRVPCPATQR